MTSTPGGKPAQAAAPGAASLAYLSRAKGMLIGGQWVPAASGKTIPVIDPAQGKIICTVPSADATDINRAVDAARTAFERREWAGLRAADRERMILRLADLVEKNADELADIECFDNGKSAAMARRVDVRGAAEFLRYIAGWSTKIEGSTIDVSFPRPRQGGEYFAYTRKEPVGVVGAIIPWNFPLLMAAWKLGPALATGCTIILKPAEETPLSALRLGELAVEAGIPSGVLNIVTGYGHTAGAALVAHPGVDKIAFTGSTEVGRIVGKAAMDRLARVSLELGGKSPVIVFEDADATVAAAGASNAIFYNHGQVCCAGSRLYVQKQIFDNVVGKIVDRANRMKVGCGFDPTTEMGPIVSQQQLDRVWSYLEIGRTEGARVVAGGERLDGPGYFMRPTVFVDTSNRMKVVREEIFGPVVCVQSFDDDSLDAVAKFANDTEYGLQASVWTRNLKVAHMMARKIKAGTICINTHNYGDPAWPFGGYKQSGWGREMGKEVMEHYTETKSVAARL